MNAKRTNQNQQFSLYVVVSIVLLGAGCPDTQEPRDAASSNTSEERDGGIENGDGGQTEDAGSSRVPDSGVSHEDAGIETYDAGNTADAGDDLRDAGGVTTDAGNFNDSSDGGPPWLNQDAGDLLDVNDAGDGQVGVDGGEGTTFDAGSLDSCGEGTFDADSDPSTACVACSTCPHGTTQTQPCTSLADTACEPCAYGTFDDDADALTACVACMACGQDQIVVESCSPFADANCGQCGQNPTQFSMLPFDPQNPDYSNCTSVDPFCEDMIDVVVFFTPSFYDLLGQDVSAVEEAIAHTLFVANDSLNNSMVPPHYRYRLVGVEMFPYEERDVLKADLVFLRNNPYYQARRKALGADVALFYFGTDGYGAMAYSNGGTGGSYVDRGLMVMDAYYLTDDFERCGTTYTTPSHEIGHILGAAHRASQYSNATGDAYGYHNQEEHLRRNEAFGLPVTQHDLKFFTLMSYSNFKNIYNQGQACPDCTQINVFASPDLWWFFNPADPLYGYCIVVNEDDPQAVQIICQGDDAWVAQQGSFVLDQSSVLTFSGQEIIDRAVPVGVEQPSYIDPVTDELVERNFITDNRSQVLSFWPFRTQNAHMLAASCSVDCAAQNRIGCSESNLAQCGDCLPGALEINGICYGRIDQSSNMNALFDERYESTDAIASASGPETVTFTIDPQATIYAIELYLMTLDENGAPDYFWARSTSTIWNQPEAPPHTFQVTAFSTSATTVIAAFPDGSVEMLQDSSGQSNNSLSYRKVLEIPLTGIESMEIQLSNALQSGETSAYDFSIAEVRVFGELQAN